VVRSAFFEAIATVHTTKVSPNFPEVDRTLMPTPKALWHRRGVKRLNYGGAAPLKIL
jgi:hypothetical protein